MFRTKLSQVLTGLLLAGLLVAACAEPDGGGAGAGQGATTTVPARPPRTTQAPSAGELTVTGTVSEGVEPNCLLLDAEGGQRYLLVGGDRAELRAGSRVAVTGRVDRGLLSTCQQGEPLVVSAIELAP
ncbi:MAG TPA: hypothetical protein VJB61_00175 [Actinomycetota bacterium]